MTDLIRIDTLRFPLFYFSSSNFFFFLPDLIFGSVIRAVYTGCGRFVPSLFYFLFFICFILISSFFFTRFHFIFGSIVRVVAPDAGLMNRRWYKDELQGIDTSNHKFAVISNISASKEHSLPLVEMMKIHLIW